MMRFLAVIILVSMASVASAENARQAANKACAISGNRVCAWENFALSYRERPEAKVVYSEVAGPTLGGARLELTVDKPAKRGAFADARTAAEQTIGLVAERHPDTRHMMAASHVVRAEACASLGDDACAAQSAAYLCAHQSRLALPAFVKTENEQVDFIERANAVLVACEES